MRWKQQPASSPGSALKKLLVIGAERLSRLIDWTDRNTCVIFGDGAGAVVLGEGDAYLSSKLFARGGDNVIRIPHFEGQRRFNTREQQHPYIYMKRAGDLQIRRQCHGW